MRLTLVILLALACGAPLCAAPHTPKVGSPERTAIADAMRAYAAEHAVRPLPHKLVFKIEFLRVDGDYAGFEGFPIFADGSDAIPEYMPDVVYCTFLKKMDGQWQVLADLSRTDVPDETELRQIKSRFPAEIPASVMPDYWRRFLAP